MENNQFGENNIGQAQPGNNTGTEISVQESGNMGFQNNFQDPKKSHMKSFILLISVLCVVFCFFLYKFINQNTMQDDNEQNVNTQQINNSSEDMQELTSVNSEVSEDGWTEFTPSESEKRQMIRAFREHYDQTTSGDPEKLKNAMIDMAKYHSGLSDKEKEEAITKFKNPGPSINEAKDFASLTRFQFPQVLTQQEQENFFLTTSENASYAKNVINKTQYEVYIEVNDDSYNINYADFMLDKKENGDFIVVHVKAG